MVNGSILNNPDIEKQRKFVTDNIGYLSPNIVRHILTLLALQTVKFKGNLEMNLAFKDGVLSEQIKYKSVEGYFTPPIKYCISIDKDGKGLKFEKMEVRDN